MRFYGALGGAPRNLRARHSLTAQPNRAGRDNKTLREEHAPVTERSLLAALIAGLILPAATNAQDSPGSAWQCRQDPAGGWHCIPAAAGDTAPAPTVPPTTEGPVTAPAIAPAPAASTTGTAPAPESSETTAPVVAPLPDGSIPSPPSAATRAAKTTTAPPLAADSKPDESYQPWALCGARSLPELPPAELSGSELSAERAEMQGQVYVLTGDAVVDRAGRRVQADRIRYDEALGEVQADGNVRLDEAALSVTGSSARLLLDSDQGEIEDVRYEVYAQHARGQAQLARQESPVRKVFDKATYTTCDEDREAWRLNAGEVVLQEDEGVGTARNAWLEIADMPVLYTPYISFPIDDRRKSGLLVPSWGSSQNGGTEFALPYYWNIAPHRDATITPRVLAKRGLQMQGEFRYLNPTNRGELGLEYLPGDSEYADEDRRLVRVDHSGRPLRRLAVDVHAADVSDDQYFEDLGSDLEVSSTTHLERLAQAAYFGTGWTLTGRVQDFQTVDSTVLPANQPYKRLPQLLLNAAPRTRPYGVELTLMSELVQFDHDEQVDGTRVDLQPRLSLPLGGAAWFLTPAASVRHTQYSLDDQTLGRDEDPSRTTPIATVDSGLFFERNVDLFGNGLLQTLEPRAFYLYVPHEDQADLPVFDTALRDFNFQQMFEDNRFTGPDRMGDANQLTLAATTRLLDPLTGTQHASFSLGEIFYFRDREVTLSNNQPASEQSASNLVAELDLRLSRSWKTVAGLQWDPFESKTERSSIRFQYRPDPRHLLNFSYRYRSNQLEQIDTSALWYFNPRWHGVVRWNYSLPDNELLEGLAGVEYESCCWIMRVMARSYISDIQGEKNDAILFQLELKGLTSFGDPIEHLLEDGILGYTRN